AHIEKRPLYSMLLIAVRQPFYRRDLLLSDATKPRYTGALGLAVDQHRAGATLPFAAPVLASCQVEMLAQHGKQAGLGIDVQRIRFLINRKPNRCHSELQKRNCSADQLRLALHK